MVDFEKALLKTKLEKQEQIADAFKKVVADHHMMLRQIQDMALLAMNSNYDRDQLQLVVTRIHIKIMDYGIHPHEAAIPYQPDPYENYPQNRPMPHPGAPKGE